MKDTNSFLSDRSKGIFLSVVGILALTPDALLLRKTSHIPNYNVLFYRFLSFAMFMFVGLLITEGKSCLNKIKDLGRWGTATGIVFGAAQLFIAIGMQNTAAANVLVIESSNPVFAMIFSWLIIHESTSNLTFGTSVVCILAILLIFIGDYNESDSNSSNSIGLLFAIGASVLFGLYVVMLRWLSLYQAGMEIDMMPCNIIAGLFAAVVCLCAGTGSTSELLTVSSIDMVYMVLQGLSLAAGFAMVTLAPTYIPAPEVSLYTLVETVLGPVWVYLGGYEAPSVFAIAGGAILLAALAVHSILSLYKDAEPAENAKEGAYLLKDRKIEYTAVDESRDTATVLLPSLGQLAV